MVWNGFDVLDVEGNGFRTYRPVASFVRKSMIAGV